MVAIAREGTQDAQTHDTRNCPNFRATVGILCLLPNRQDDNSLLVKTTNSQRNTDPHLMIERQDPFPFLGGCFSSYDDNNYCALKPTVLASPRTCVYGTKCTASQPTTNSLRIRWQEPMFVLFFFWLFLIFFFVVRGTMIPWARDDATAPERSDKKRHLFVAWRCWNT